MVSSPRRFCAKLFLKLLSYTIMGALAGLSGIIIAAKVNAGVPTAGEGYELDVITAVVIGRVSLSGGEASISRPLWEWRSWEYLSMVWAS